MRNLISFALTASLLPAVATAQPIIAQTAGLANPAQVFDFGANLFPNFTPISTEFAGITVAHARYFTTGTSNNLVGGFLTNDPATPGPNTLRVQFSAPITDVSFVYHQIATGTSVIRAMLGGVVIDSFAGSWNQTQPNNYFGFANTALDEIQIDFQNDFNIDTIAISPSLPGAAACVTYNGTGTNADAFTCQTLPILGTTWQASIAPGPNTVLTAIAYAPGGTSTPIPLFGGELLIQPSPAPTLFASPGSYSLAIPSQTSWIGTTLTFQGLRINLVGGALALEPLNAIDAIVGM